jgi:hypothetical protein
LPLLLRTDTSDINSRYSAITYLNRQQESTYVRNGPRLLRLEQWIVTPLKVLIIRACFINNVSK